METDVTERRGRGRPKNPPQDASASLYPKGSKAESAHRNVGRLTAKQHKLEQAKALVMEPEKSTWEELEGQVNKIIARYTF